MLKYIRLGGMDWVINNRFIELIDYQYFVVIGQMYLKVKITMIQLIKYLK